jgi:hypothetical protein
MQYSRSIILLSVLFLACAGEDGATGPQGPSGNANVKSMTATITSWSQSGTSWNAAIGVSMITAAIVSKGAVTVFLSNGGGGWEQLPLTIYPSSSYSSTMTAVHYVGGVTIHVFDSDKQLPIEPGTCVFKIVAIAGSEIARNPDLDLTDYEELAKRYNLGD